VFNQFAPTFQNDTDGNSGEGGIRTHGGVTPTPVFETGLFNRSSTSPRADCRIIIVRDRNRFGYSVLDGI
jgi:hypothetical protein